MGNPAETEGNWEKPGNMERVREENQGEIERNRGGGRKSEEKQRIRQIGNPRGGRKTRGKPGEMETSPEIASTSSTRKQVTLEGLCSPSFSVAAFEQEPRTGERVQRESHLPS